MKQSGFSPGSLVRARGTGLDRFARARAELVAPAATDSRPSRRNRHLSTPRRWHKSHPPNSRRQR